MATKFTYEAARRLATEYCDNIKEIRRALVAKARDNAQRYPNTYSDDEHRKLKHYPGDFSEKKLIELAERKPNLTGN